MPIETTKENARYVRMIEALLTKLQGDLSRIEQSFVLDKQKVKDRIKLLEDAKSDLEKGESVVAVLVSEGIIREN